MLFKETGCLLNGFGKLLLLQMFGHIDFVEVNRIPDLAGTEHRINCRQNHSSNGNNGPFLTSALGDALVFQSIVRVFLVLYRSVSDLHQSRHEINTGPRDTNRLLLSGGFVVAGIRPAQQHSRLEEPN